MAMAMRPTVMKVMPETFQWFGYITILHLFTDSTHRHDGQSPTYTATKGINDGVDHAADVL